MDGLILFSHGSLLCGAGEALEEHALRLRSSGEWPIVEIGYLNYSDPTFAEAVARCYEQSANRIVVLPFFLIPGYFVTKSLPEQVQAAQAKYPDLEFRVADAIGFDPALADMLIAAALEPLGPDKWRDDLAAAARNCRARLDCPLFNTPKCPHFLISNNTLE